MCLRKQKILKILDKEFLIQHFFFKEKQNSSTLSSPTGKHVHLFIFIPSFGVYLPRVFFWCSQKPKLQTKLLSGILLNASYLPWQQSILTWRLLAISSKIFSCDLNSLICEISHICDCDFNQLWSTVYFININNNCLIVSHHKVLLRVEKQMCTYFIYKEMSLLFQPKHVIVWLVGRKRSHNKPSNENGTSKILNNHSSSTNSNGDRPKKETLIIQTSCKKFVH